MTHTTPAIILRTRPLREADLWVRFATPQGRLTAIANSALKSRKRFPSGLPLGSEVEIRYHEGKTADLVSLDELNIAHGFLHRPPLDYQRLSALSYALELVDRSWPEHQASPEKFDCVAGFLRGLASAADPAPALIAFCWDWLRCLGFLPMITACARCDADYRQQDHWVVVVEAGGLVCPRCRHASEQGIAMTAQWQRDVIHLWITRVLDLKLNSESCWELL